MAKRGDQILDVVIIGGGPAGLSAALTLGRCLRRVMVCDAGHPRNEAAKMFNGFLSRDGSTPGAFLEICREQLRRYATVEFRAVKVVAIEREDKRFAVITEAGERLEARIVLLATGLTDKLPAVEGLRECYGDTVHSCPYCDGWENRAKEIAVLGNTQEAADLAIELKLWSDDVVLAANGPLQCDVKTVAQMRRKRIEVFEKPVVRLEREGSKLQGIRFQNGQFLARSVLYFMPKQVQRSSLAEQLGCEFCPEDNCIRCGEDTATCVPGVYAAGNATRGVQLVIFAAAEGTRAAVAINNALLEAGAEEGDC
jgi:thioredoxin reductase